MGNSAAAPVITGLAVGIAFVLAFSWAVSNMPPPTSSTEEDEDLAVEITRNFNEVKEFLSNYPTANTTVYFITTCADESCSSLSRVPSIVEYWYREWEDGGKYTDLRIVVHFEERSVTLFQLRCLTEGSENNSIEVHGSSLQGITEFLQNSQCPK